MSVDPGTRLGPYEILAPLGAGGMGEVYRARDTRLGREVAIKVLPQHLTTEPEVRARFEREAKTVSSLNHPNICMLFDVGSEGGTDYLVMELLEGETLAQRLGKGAMPPADVLRLGAQIADALDRAHRVGIVHRDLKPGNVMLTKSGAKLMDFGLARATGLAGPMGSGLSMTGLTQSPTIAAPLTAEGTIVGTFQYMAPEQLEGREADARSDLWALGCVLYEMASGRRAFEGRSQATLIAAIMDSEPRPLSQIAPLSPAPLDRLVGRCLAKDPDDRWQTARDLMHELRAIAGGPASTTSVSGVAAVVQPQRRAGTPRWMLAAVAVVAALAGLTLGVALRPRREARLPMQLSMLPPAGTQVGTISRTVAISPDGRSVAYAATNGSQPLGLFLQSFDALEPRRVLESAAIGSPFFSPDGDTLGVLDTNAGRLVTMPLMGGSPTVIGEARGGRGATWNRAGVIVFAPSPSGPLFRVAASGGEPVQVTWPDAARHEAAHRYPWFLPDGEHFLFASLPANSDGFDIYVGSLGSREVVKIMTAGSAPTYAEPGYLLFRRSGKLMAQKFDARALKLEGEPVAIADAPPESDFDAEPIAQASSDGRLVVLDARAPETQLCWFDRTGALRDTLALPEGTWGRPQISPDDRFAVLPNGSDLWRVDLSRAIATRLTSKSGINFEPVWSPDGSRIAFSRGHQGREEILVMSADGSGQVQELATTPDLFKLPTDWTPSGLLFSSIGPGTLQDLYLLPDGAGAKAEPWLKTSFSESRGVVSQDGRWCAYLSNEAGIDDVYIQSFPVAGHKVRVSTMGASRIWWLSGGAEVCFRASRGADAGNILCAAVTHRGADLEVGEPRLLFKLPPSVVGTNFTHDGQRLLANASSPGAQGNTIRVILDWTGLVGR